MATEVKAFTCDFCRVKKRFASKAGAVRHEKNCFYNPIRHACATCKNFSFTPHYAEHDTGYYEGGPSCELGKLNNDPESRSQLRAECVFWEPKTATDLKG